MVVQHATSPETRLWRVRPAGATHQGSEVSYAELADAISKEDVGDLDEVLAPGSSRWLAVCEHELTAHCVPRPRRSMARPFEDAETDMTPMIDVTFQLLIFFMIAATYVVHKTLDIPQNQRQEEGASTVTMQDLASENVVISVSEQGAVKVEGTEIPLAELEAELRKAMRTKRSSEVVLDVADQALHEVVVAVLDAAGGAQVDKVLFVSRTRNATPPSQSAP